MIERPTVLILGAGASSHLGYPIGRGLINAICASIQNQSCHLSIRERWSEDQLEDFRLRLSRSGYASVDAFLEAYPDDAQLGKLLIVDSLVKHEKEDSLFPPFNAGWYDYLFGRMCSDEPTGLIDNRLSIVTFNYDRSLEVFLTQSVRYRYNIEQNEALRLVAHIPIIHTYGFLGAYPEFPYSSEVDAEGLRLRADAIRTIGEQGPADAFESASEHLKSAETIYFLGFGFHPENMDRFGFFSKENLNGKTVYSTCMGQLIEKDELINRLSEYGLTRASFPIYADCNLFFRRVATL